MEIFNSVFSESMTVGTFFLMLGVALVSGILFSWLTSFKIRSSTRFYITNAILPAVIAMIIALVNGNIGAGVAIAGAFSLVRFRSAQGSAEEIGTIFITVAAGLAFGMGYLTYGVIFLILMGAIYVLLHFLPIFNHKARMAERQLRIIVPEDLDYTDAFEDVFQKYTKEHRLLSTKTSNMGSLYKLTYRIQMKDVKDERKMIDDLRVKNGNLEVMISQIGDEDGSIGL